MKTFQCEGTCGRTLRHRRYTLTTCPDTVAVHRDRKCRACYTGGAPVTRGTLPPVFGCDGGCGKTLRMKTVDPSTYPGTITRYMGRMCKPCYTNQPAEADTTSAVRDLAAFLGRIKQAGRRNPMARRPEIKDAA